MDLYAVGLLKIELLTGVEMIDYGRNFGKLAVPPLRVLAPGLDIPEAIDAIGPSATSAPASPEPTRWRWRSAPRLPTPTPMSR